MEDENKVEEQVEESTEEVQPEEVVSQPEEQLPE